MKEPCNKFSPFAGTVPGQSPYCWVKENRIIFYSSDIIGLHIQNTVVVPCRDQSCTKRTLPKSKTRNLSQQAPHLIWIRGYVGEGKSHTIGVRLALVKYLHFTASLGHRQKPNPHYPSVNLTLQPAWCRRASCSAARNRSPSPPWTAAWAWWGAASVAGAGGGVRTGRDGNGEGEGHSQALLGAGTCPAAWQTNVVFYYWLKGGALQGSMLRNCTFSVCRCPFLYGVSLAAVAGGDLCWQSHGFSSLKWTSLYWVWGI